MHERCPGQPHGGGRPVWQLLPAVFVVLLLIMAAADHLLGALPGVHPRYEGMPGGGSTRWVHR